MFTFIIKLFCVIKKKQDTPIYSKNCKLVKRKMSFTESNDFAVLTILYSN